MRRLSIRWKLVGMTMAVATGIASLVVCGSHIRTRNQLLGQVEGTLGAKSDEIITVLREGPDKLALDSFLAVETSYRATPHEYFYQITDGAGQVVARSPNLARGRLVSPAREEDGSAWTSRVRIETLPHPFAVGETVRSRSERLPDDVRIEDHGELTAQIGVSLSPLHEQALADLGGAIGYALGGLGLLFAFLWTTIGRGLVRVSEITRRVSEIRTTNLRQRLPITGSGDELDQLSDVLNGMLEGLQRSLVQMDAFTSDAAHQLRTPLTRIRGELDLLLQGASELSSGTRVRLGSVREELERLTRTCGKLLLLARLDRGKLEEELLAEQVDLKALVQDLVEQFGPLADERRVSVACGDVEPLVVHGSEQLIVEALLNLLDNAVRFSPPNGAILISLAQHGGMAEIVVTDDGPGVAGELRELIFRRFFRHVESGASVGEGAGLGLAIVRGIARAHGGDVSCEGTPRRGSSFRFCLPAA